MDETKDIDICNDCAVHYYDQMNQRHYCPTEHRIIDDKLLGNITVPVPKWCPKRKDR